MPRKNRDELGLTPRQREIVELLRSGCRTKEIAEKCSLSVHTVGTYFKLLYQHFGVHSRCELIARCTAKPNTDIVHPEIPCLTIDEWVVNNS